MGHVLAQAFDRVESEADLELALMALKAGYLASAPATGGKSFVTVYVSPWCMCTPHDVSLHVDS